MQPRSAEEIIALAKDPHTDIRDLLLYVDLDEDASEAFLPRATAARNLARSAPGHIATSSFGGFADNLIELERRQRRDLVRRELMRNPSRPVILCEGDSWYQHPIITDVVDWIEKAGFLPDCFSEAGDLLSRMTGDDSDFVRALQNSGLTYRAFVFSGGGNDILGSESDAAGNSVSVLRRLLAEPKAGMKPKDFVKTKAVDEMLEKVAAQFKSLVETVERIRPGLPIILHGYDYAIPNGSLLDLRVLFRSRWLAGPLAAHGITEHRLQRDVVAALVDRFYEEVLLPLDRAHATVKVAELRETNVNVGSWADEIHPSSWGFQPIAEKILALVPDAFV